MTPETKTARGQSVRPIATLVACVVSAQIGTSAVNVALPELAAWSGGEFADAQWTVVAYLLAMTAASLVVGYVGDQVGRDKALLGGLVVFLVAGIACALAPSLWVLVVTRAVQGIGAAAMAALPLAIARDVVAADRSGSIMGLLGTASAIGTAAGPVLGGLLLEAWGWSAIFWAMLPLPLIAFAAVLRSRVRPSVATTEGAVAERGQADSPLRRAFDASGAVIVALAAVAYAAAFTGPAAGTGWSLGLMAAAGVFIAVLVPVERRASRPVLPLTLLRTGSVGGGAVLNLVVGAVMMSTLVVGPFYLSGALGLSPAAVGLAMAAGPVVSIAAGVLAGRLVDRGAPARLITAALAAMATAVLALALLPPVWGLVGYLTGTMILAPGYQLFLAANNTHVMDAVVPDRRGTASGILGLSRNLGLVTGSSVMGTLFAAAAAAADTDAAGTSTSALDAGLRLVFGVAAATLAIAAVASLTSGSTSAATNTSRSPGATAER